MKLGFIGAGNMANAILRGAIRSGFLSDDSLFISDINRTQCEKIKAEFPSVQIESSNAALTQSCDYVVLAVKPIFLGALLQEIKPYVNGKRIISIAAGWRFEKLIDILDLQSGAQVLRVMPNTPALVGEGFTALCEETTFDADSLEWATHLFETLGEVSLLPERLFDAVIAVSGSSPAYVYMFIEAMADGAVKLGMPRPLAYRVAAQAVLGAAKMVLETNEHPAKLKDDVCSPGGTTIEAVDTLERMGFRGAVLSAMEACADKSKNM